MPAFTFEKISRPAGREPVASVESVPQSSVPSGAKKPRGVIVQILDRFVETRVKRTLSQEMREENGVTPRRKPTSRD